MPIHDWSRVPCGLFHDLSIRPDPGPARPWPPVGLGRGGRTGRDVRSGGGAGSGRCLGFFGKAQLPGPAGAEETSCVPVRPPGSGSAPGKLSP